MALTGLSSTWKVSLNFTGQKQPVGGDYSPIQASDIFGPSYSVGTGVANTSVGGGDELISAITTISASGNTSLDLTNLTDILNQTGVSLARVKSVMIRLLSTTDDATNGTNCSCITLGNSGANDWTSQSHTGWFGSATSTFDIPNGGCLVFCTPSATGVLVDGTHKLIHIVNQDSSNPAAVQVSLGGGTT